MIFNLNLILLAADHLISGSYALFFPKKAISLYVKMFGATLPQSQEYYIILRPWGALGVFAGLVGLLPVLSPEKYVLVLIILMILLSTRIIYRIKFQQESKQFFHLSRQRNLFHLLLILTSMATMAIQVFYLVGLN